MAGGRRFVTYLGRVRPTIEAALEASVAPDGDGGAGTDLDRYLYGPLARFTASGGKRVRPALCLLGAEAAGGDPARALAVACAVELFQSAALVHDDIADSGTLRRGEPCLHVSEGVGVAINVGDAALTAMFGMLVRETALEPATRLAVLDELTSMAERTLEGQALDLGWVRDGRWDITVDDYLTMATCKTAHYSAASPLVCGALCGGATSSQVEALRTFGLRAGLAFQLQDDLLNVMGDAAALGKDFRSDLTEGKRTLLVTHALAHLPAASAGELVEILSSGTTDADALAGAVALMEAAGSPSYVRERARDLVVEAKAALVASQLAPESVETLSSMADFFVERTT